MKTHANFRYHKLHSLYMSTPVFSEKGKKIKRILDKAREKYIQEVKENFPGIIVF